MAIVLNISANLATWIQIRKINGSMEFQLNHNLPIHRKVRQVSALKINENHKRNQWKFCLVKENC